MYIIRGSGNRIVDEQYTKLWVQSALIYDLWSGKNTNQPSHVIDNTGGGVWLNRHIRVFITL